MTQPINKPSFLSESLQILALIVSRKHSFIVSPRDAAMLGIDDYSLITRLETVLDRLVRTGLARKLKSRPKRYFIKLWVAESIVTYRFRCFRGLYCPYTTKCPIRKTLKKLVKRTSKQQTASKYL